MATLLPAMAFLIHKFIYRQDVNTYQIHEKYDTFLEALNLLDLYPYNQKKSTLVAKSEKSIKPFVKADRLDDVYRIYLGVAIFYYLSDVMVKMYEFEFPNDYLDLCQLAFFLHHIFTLLSFKSIFVIDHQPWFLVFPTAYHPMMVVFPKFKLNNPIYITSVVCWMYGLTRPAYWETRIGRSLFMISCFLMIPISMLWLGTCMSEFQYEMI
ncbi:UNKNOWN [Stylonychia lemnae]|uniref:TLC domain-containing protein n=1 Tax=Stylonychia lemnae TaxID=5949 RepID=A0A077ZNT5_STYLE|nr:UNKNOWN [Stylonychia lemnae]|eukprot:CDW71627.1 UNKNOWN [Stylonychia lemnae]